MSITQVNPTVNMTEETISSDGTKLLESLGIGAFHTTELKKFNFKYDPWVIKSTDNKDLTALNTLRLTVARATDTAGTPSSFIVVSYNQVYYWQGAPTRTVYLQDINGANILQFDLPYTPARCGEVLKRAITIDFDPQYFDIVKSGLFTMGPTTWSPC